MSEAAHMGAMELSVDLLAWRTALADAPPVPSGADLVEWTRLLADAGHREGAALLADVAALHEGFSPQLRADRSRPFGRTAPGRGEDMAVRATAELRQLATAARPSGITGAAAGPDRTAAGPVGGDLAGLARLLCRLLDHPLTGKEGELAAVLHALTSAAARWRGLDHRAFAHAPLSVLVPAIVAVALADFTLRTRDLWDGPEGSPALFHRVSRFDNGGLGPYLSNVGRLARNGRDVADMARIARDAAVEAGNAEPGASAEPWIVLLSRRCGPELLREIVDDLGDAGAAGALLAILKRVTSGQAGVDLETVMRLRDAGIDNADYLLAESAQRAIVRLRPDSELEGMVLGSIQASSGAPDRAEATFRHWLARSPGHEGLRDRLAALMAGRFEPFAVSGGFGSPAVRQALRRHRRGLQPDYLRRRGERMEAVEVR